MTMTIWGVGTPRSFRPIWTAEELGLTYEHKPIGPRTGETKTKDYTALTRKQKIPFFQDEKVKLSESVAICRYLIGEYGGEAISPPTDAIARAKEDEWICYLYGEVDETSLYVMRRHGDLAAVYGEAPAAVASAKVYAERHLTIVAEQLGDSRFLLGGQFGLADIILTSCVDWARFYGLEIPGQLTNYRDRIADRPAYQAAWTKNYPQLTQANNTQGGD